MIDEIQVENLALTSREAALVPARGLTVLTGETGSRARRALLSALKLLMGARADKDAVRDGEEALVVSGRFYGVALDGLEDADAEADLRELVATRPRHRGRPLARLPRRPPWRASASFARGRGARHRLSAVSTSTSSS